MNHDQQHIVVLGAGSFGTALAQVLAENGHPIFLYARRKEQADELQTSRKNLDYLPELILHPLITVTHDLALAIQGAKSVLIAVPSSAFRDTLMAAKPYLSPETYLMHATKGFDPKTHERMTEVMRETLPDISDDHFAVVTGPSHAEEVSKRCPTTVVVASQNRMTAEHFQDLLMSPYFRVYTNSDVIGAEVSGALKNIIALGCGISDGLGFGDNAKAALMTRGLTEITRLGVAMGASPQTFSGLAGVGDLIVTCTSVHSRNWRFGYQIGQGKKIEEILSSTKMVVEGVKTIRIVQYLSAKYGIEMPISTVLHQILFEGVHPLKGVSQLMNRVKTHEMEI